MLPTGNDRLIPFGDLPHLSNDLRAEWKKNINATSKLDKTKLLIAIHALTGLYVVNDTTRNSTGFAQP